MDGTSSLIATQKGFLILAAVFVGSLTFVARPLLGLAVAVVAAVLIEYLTLDFTLMAAVGTTILVGTTLGVLEEKRRAWVGSPVRLRTPVDRLFAGFALVGVVYLVIGLARGNDKGYALGDFYHIVFELVVPFFLCTVFIKSTDQYYKFTRIMGLAMLVLGILVLMLYFTGAIREMAGGGMKYRLTDVWRLRISHNFPLPPLVWLAAVWLCARKTAAARLGGLGTVTLVVALMLTLKRTAWVAVGVVAITYFVAIDARQRLKFLGAAAALIVAAQIAAHLLSVGDGLRSNGELEQYTESVTKRFSEQESDVRSTLLNRKTELSDALEIVESNPFGHGLGSEFMVEHAAGRLLVRRHYIHNVFLHYLLQSGVLYVLLLIAVSVRFFATAVRLLRGLQDGPLRGVVLGSTGAYVAILISSMTELSIHTFFTPYSLALVFLAEPIARREGLLSRTRASTLAASSIGGDVEGVHG